MTFVALTFDNFSCGCLLKGPRGIKCLNLIAKARK